MALRYRLRGGWVMMSERRAETGSIITIAIAIFVCVWPSAAQHFAGLLWDEAVWPDFFLQNKNRRRTRWNYITPLFSHANYHTRYLSLVMIIWRVRASGVWFSGR